MGLTGGDFRPLTTGLCLFLGGRSIDIGPLAAGTLITIIPVIVGLNSSGLVRPGLEPH